jgi:hypothetical protein
MLTERLGYNAGLGHPPSLLTLLFLGTTTLLNELLQSRALMLMFSSAFKSLARLFFSCCSSLAFLVARAFSAFLAFSSTAMLASAQQTAAEVEFRRHRWRQRQHVCSSRRDLYHEALCWSHDALHHRDDVHHRAATRPRPALEIPKQSHRGKKLANYARSLFRPGAITR